MWCGERSSSVWFAKITFWYRGQGRQWLRAATFSTLRMGWWGHINALFRFFASMQIQTSSLYFFWVATMFETHSVGSSTGSITPRTCIAAGTRRGVLTTVDTFGSTFIEEVTGGLSTSSLNKSAYSWNTLCYRVWSMMVLMWCTSRLKVTNFIFRLSHRPKIDFTSSSTTWNVRSHGCTPSLQCI